MGWEILDDAQRWKHLKTTVLLPPGESVNSQQNLKRKSSESYNAIDCAGAPIIDWGLHCRHDLDHQQKRWESI
ncbi:hypothetical protein OUZ56_027876 [Daphnia magna]|uniref:Uncharacterized protein n=1 Tax=Daphnia magna TaxID=35525 RepID=A0ABR0B271_9CRUS|nr:hypothetical protein OUZ56_027876 [Daphnia magna]